MLLFMYLGHPRLVKLLSFHRNTFPSHPGLLQQSIFTPFTHIIIVELFSVVVPSVVIATLLGKAGRLMGFNTCLLIGPVTISFANAMNSESRDESGMFGQYSIEPALPSLGIEKG
jgi:hypothetical protein